MIPGTDLTVENNLIAAGSAIKIAFPVRQVPETKTNVRLAFNTVSAVSGLLILLPPPRARPACKASACGDPRQHLGRGLCGFSRSATDQGKSDTARNQPARA